MDNVYWDFWNPYDILDLARFLIHDIYSATIAVNLPYFDRLYVSKYNNYLLPSNSVSDAVPVQNIYESWFPFHPILEGRRYV